MDGSNRVLDDLAKLATSAVGILQGAGREAEELMRQRFERLLDRMDLVKREEFDAVKAMAVAAREENERLAKRLEELDALLARTTPAKAGTGGRAGAAGRTGRSSKGKAATSRKRAGKAA